MKEISIGSITSSKTESTAGAKDYDFERFKKWQKSDETSHSFSSNADSIICLDNNNVEVYRADIFDKTDLKFMVLDYEKVLCKQSNGTRKEITYYKMLIIELGLVRWMSGLFFNE